MSPLSFGLGRSFVSGSNADLSVQYGRYFVFEYQFTSGSDLDTRTGFLTPDIGVEDTKYIGWSRTGNSYLHWGGDNTGNGYESVYIDKEEVLADYPSATVFEIDLRCFWYGSVGSNPVIIKTNVYTGGTMVQSGFQWTNPTATYSFPASYSIGRIITSTNRTDQGQQASVVTIDFNTFSLSYS